MFMALMKMRPTALTSPCIKNESERFFLMTKVSLKIEATDFRLNPNLDLNKEKIVKNTYP